MREDLFPLKVVLRLNRVGQSQVEAEACHAHSFRASVYPDQVVSENRLEIGNKWHSIRVRKPPAVNETLESLDEENPRAASRIENLQVPVWAVPREYPVTHEIDEMRRRVISLPMVLFLVTE